MFKSEISKRDEKIRLQVQEWLVGFLRIRSGNEHSFQARISAYFSGLFGCKSSKNCRYIFQKQKSSALAICTLGTKVDHEDSPYQSKVQSKQFLILKWTCVSMNTTIRANFFLKNYLACCYRTEV